jgi:hypothetical protein|tara:strand:+ start:112 stop:699 length:588 start_codon:yes stop_codon:yes gene_type:complete
MAYGDITNEFVNGYVTRSRTGVETITSAVVLKDGSTKGSAAIDFTSNTLNLDQLTAIQAKNKAGVYVGTAGDLCVLLSGQSAPIATGTADGNTANKLIDSGATFTTIKGGIQKRDIAVNLTDSTAAFVGAVDSATTLSLVDVSNSNSDTFPDGNENYEIYRAILFQNIAAGSLLPIEVDRVFSLGTTTTDIILLY